MSDGYEIHVHQSLTVPLTMAGVPRDVMIFNGMMTASFVMVLHTLWILPFSLIIHLVFVSASRADPEIGPVIVRHLKQCERLEV